MAYRFALFDADNTLLDFTYAERMAIRACLRARGLTDDEATLSLYSTINDRQWKALERGETTRERLKVERFADLFTALQYDGDAASMAQDYISALSQQGKLLDGALELVQRIHGKCELYIITNGISVVQKSRFARCGLAPYFKRCFISEEMGCAKPEKIFFDQVAEAIDGFNPSKALVIGDSLSSDMLGGIRAGLDTCWYSPKGAKAPADMSITYQVSDLSEIIPILLD